MFHSQGHGYDNPTMPGLEPCTAFDGLESIANPLGGTDNASRERRVFGRHPVTGNGGVTYASHSLQLGIRHAPDRDGDTERQAEMRRQHRVRELYLMMSHGGGREVYTLRNGVHCVPILDTIQMLPEDVQYSLLYSIWEAQQESRRQAQRETAQRWAQAHVNGTIRKRRNGTVEIESPYETEARKARKAVAA